MSTSRARSLLVCAVAALAVAALTFPAGAQAPDPAPPFGAPTVTTAAAPATVPPTTAPPGPLDWLFRPPPPPPPPAPPGDDPAPAPDGSPPPAAPPADGAVPGDPSTDPEAGVTGGLDAPPPAAITPEARAIINSVRRSGPRDNEALLAGMQALVAQGLPIEEAIRIGFGRFPIAGEARYTHDWLFPRGGATGFRFHRGTDVFAAYGTPVRAPADGTASASNGGLGGIAVKVFEPDGTYYYMAHLSGLADGFANGMAVKVGDIVGFVGDSGNARGGSPHVHLGVFPRGGAAVDPKAILDGWLDDALAALPAIQATQASVASPFGAAPLRLLAGMADLGRFNGSLVSWSQLLWSSSANPAAGALQLAEARALALASSMQWDDDDRTSTAFAAVRQRNLATARALASTLEPLGR